MINELCKLCTCVDLTCVYFSAHYTRLEVLLSGYSESSVKYRIMKSFAANCFLLILYYESILLD